MGEVLGEGWGKAVGLVRSYIPHWRRLRNPGRVGSTDR